MVEAERIPSEARRELEALIAAPEGARRPPEALPPAPHLAGLVEGWRAEVEGGRRFLVIELPPAPAGWSTFAFVEASIAAIARLLGRTLPQDTDGARTIRVWDRDPALSMAGGARYHQTHEGGSIHTDNVNQPKLWDYLLLGCVAGAAEGGETLLVDGRRLHADLQAHHPDVLATLRADFTWEYRGLGGGVYTAPVITYDRRGECRFRYLRPYVEAAHARTGAPLSPDQVRAFDVLDGLLAQRERQIRFTLAPGQILLARDSQILHGRTAFVDPPGAVPAEQAGPGQLPKRTMIRCWVEREEPARDLDDRYGRARLLLSEQMYGPGFQSSGGERFLAMTTPLMGLQPGDRVLDLGCGTGGTLAWLSRRYGVGGTGVDAAPDCIALAREGVAQRGTEDLDFVRSDFRALSLRGAYHALWTCQALLYVPDKGACLARVRPHLLPGRRSVIVDYCRGEGEGSAAFRAYCDDCGFALPTVAGYASLVAGAGFRVVDAVDYTPWFQGAMEQELARLEAQRESFLTRYTEEDFEHLASRWRQKIAFCREGALRAAYVVAEVAG